MISKTPDQTFKISTNNNETNKTDPNELLIKEIPSTETDEGHHEDEHAADENEETYNPQNEKIDQTQKTSIQNQKVSKPEYNFWFERRPVVVDDDIIPYAKLKVLYPYRLTGVIIGKAGAQINKLKDKYSPCQINLPKCKNSKYCSQDRPLKIIIEKTDGRTAKNKLFNILKEITLLQTLPGVLSTNSNRNERSISSLPLSSSDPAKSVTTSTPTSKSPRANLGKLTYDYSYNICKQYVKKHQGKGHEMCEIKLLLSEKNLGLILGPGAKNANRLRETFNVDTRCYHKFCPGSSERVVSISGTTENVLKALDEDILEMFLKANRLGMDSNNRDFKEYNGDTSMQTVSHMEYGGFNIIHHGNPANLQQPAAFTGIPGFPASFLPSFIPQRHPHLDFSSSSSFAQLPNYAVAAKNMPTLGHPFLQNLEPCAAGANTGAEPLLGNEDLQMALQIGAHQQVTNIYKLDYPYVPVDRNLQQNCYQPSQNNKQSVNCLNAAGDRQSTDQSCGEAKLAAPLPPVQFDSQDQSELNSDSQTEIKTLSNSLTSEAGSNQLLGTSYVSNYYNFQNYNYVNNYYNFQNYSYPDYYNQQVN